MRILFIGGTGIISSACTELCFRKGVDLYVLNRGSSSRTIPDAVKTLKADIRNINQVKEALADLTFDVVVDWVAYKPEHVKNDVELFKDRTNQYIFISSASAYKKPPDRVPIIETDPLDNPFWEYSRNKIQCENYLMDIYRSENFPLTIVRPSHTYDKTKIPLHGGYTTINRMIEGKPVIIHGDGTSLWTLTHHKDFAKGFFGLLGKSEAIGEAYHITSDEFQTWNQICQALADPLGVQPEIIHIPSDFIIQYDKDWGDGLLGDKAHCLIFDNSKIKNINPDYEANIPYREGANEIIEWYREDPSRGEIDTELDQRMDTIIYQYTRGFNP